MNNWTKKMDKGMAVNFYYFKKMWKDTPIDEVKAILKESYEIECGSKYSKVHKMSYAEYVNAQRQFCASTMGYDMHF